MSTKTMKEIGTRLKDARTKKGLTQAQVAKQADTGTNRYAVIERGAENITVNKLEKLCKVLGIKVKDIIPF